MLFRSLNLVLQAVKQLLELPLNLTIVSPAHTPNWDLVSDVVNSCSRIYRSSKQCRSRYENVLIPREEGKVRPPFPRGTRLGQGEGGARGAGRGPGLGQTRPQSQFPPARAPAPRSCPVQSIHAAASFARPCVLPVARRCPGASSCLPGCVCSRTLLCALSVPEGGPRGASPFLHRCAFPGPWPLQRLDRHQTLWSQPRASHTL